MLFISLINLNDTIFSYHSSFTLPLPTRSSNALIISIDLIESGECINSFMGKDLIASLLGMMKLSVMNFFYQIEKSLTSSTTSPHDDLLVYPDTIYSK